MQKKRVVFLGSKPIGLWCLEYLYNNKDSLNIEIVGVLSKDNTNLLHKSLNKLAGENGTKSLSSLEDLLNLQTVDFVLSVQHHEILKSRHIQAAKILATNLHMAPLPEYRGCNQFSFAIVDQKREFGTTLHQMLPGIDNGAIFFERRFQIDENTSVKELYDKTESQSKLLWAEHIGDIFSGNYTPTPQESLVADRGTSTHYRSEIHKLKQIDITWPQEKIERHLRATYMPGFPPPYALINGKKVGLIPNPN